MTEPPIRITLTWPEIELGAKVGTMRLVHRRKTAMGNASRRPEHNAWTGEIEGAQAELAVAKHLGVFWSGTVGEPGAPSDVSCYQVRCNSSRKYEDTVLRPTDKPNRVYISVLSYMPHFGIIGWLWGADGMCAEYEHPGEEGRPPCWFVPRDKLQPFSTLPVSGYR
jgi:hypothetical protein